MSVSLLTSLVLALSWTPALSQFLIKKARSKSGHTESGSADNERELAASDLPSESNESENEALRRLMKVEEESMGGFFRKIVAFHERWLRRALQRPRWLAIFSLVLIILAYVCYHFSGSDLLPEMDEGGFVLDYIMPAGSSLAETNRVVSRIEQILRETPEVENTSRRTGLQLGLAAVTEANTGDISVKLKASRKRDIEEVIADVREKIKSDEPAIDVEFVQVLQDMINDLTGEPQPVEVKLFSQDVASLEQWAPKVADAIAKDKGVVDVLNGIDNTISGPAVMFQIDPLVAARAGFTAEEVALDGSALLEGEPSTIPVVTQDRTYTVRVRFPEGNRSSLEAMRDTLLVSSAGKTATLGSLATMTEMPGQTEIRRENLLRDVVVSARLEGVDLGTGIASVKKSVEQLHLPSSIRVVYGGTYQVQQQSFRDLILVLVLAVALVFIVLLFEFRNFAAPLAILTSALISTCGVFLALFITRTTFNISSFMGMIMVIGIVAKNGILLLDAEQKFTRAGFSLEEAVIQAGRRRLRPIVMTALAAAAGMLPLAFAMGAGSQMLKPLAVAVIGGVTISMVLSLIITPAVYLFTTQRASSSAASSRHIEAPVA
jgi:multidrug efflux pump subunit AcrB